MKLLERLELTGKDIGEACYLAYARKIQRDDKHQNKYPPWDELPSKKRAAWVAGAMAVIFLVDPEGNE